MNRLHFSILFFLILVFISSCSHSQNLSTKQVCLTDGECETPGEYLLRSDCPFDSACIDGTCKVICQMWTLSPDADDYASFPVMCETDEDCSCEGYSAKDLIKCSCIREVCTAVVGMYS